MLHGVYRAVVLAQRLVDKAQNSVRLAVPWIQDNRLLCQFEGVLERILRYAIPIRFGRRARTVVVPIRRAT